MLLLGYKIKIQITSHCCAQMFQMSFILINHYFLQFELTFLFGSAKLRKIYIHNRKKKICKSLYQFISPLASTNERRSSHSPSWFWTIYALPPYLPPALHKCHTSCRHSGWFSLIWFAWSPHQAHTHTYPVSYGSANLPEKEKIKRRRLNMDMRFIFLIAFVVVVVAFDKINTIN